jgi:putative endonuclease
MWYVYILGCKDKSLYTGITDNLQRRFEEHKSGKGGKFTRAFIAEQLLYSEKQSTREAALRREAQIKRWTRKKKLALIRDDKGALKKA